MSTNNNRSKRTQTTTSNMERIAGGGAAPFPRAPHQPFLMVGRPLLLHVATANSNIIDKHSHTGFQPSAHRKYQNSNNNHQQQEPLAPTIYVATEKSEDNEQKPMQEKTQYTGRCKTTNETGSPMKHIQSENNKTVRKMQYKEL